MPVIPPLRRQRQEDLSSRPFGTIQCIPDLSEPQSETSSSPFGGKVSAEGAQNRALTTDHRAWTVDHTGCLPEKVQGFGLDTQHQKKKKTHKHFSKYQQPTK